MKPIAKLYEFNEEPKKVINGPRPSPLVINKDSHLIRKASTKVVQTKQQKIHPIIIYTESPKVIHTKAQDFMALVQRLTGMSSNNDASIPKQEEASENFGSSVSDVSNSNNNSNNETSSPLKTCVNKGSCCGANGQHSLCNNLDVADMPLFTPNSFDFFCSSRSTYKYSDSPFGILGSLISPSGLEFMKELPEY
ncbi:hypothetical protein RJT34_25533 [Clitoria ternatea]|uniref:VQ domain-containing protein n=1 Tax=Clitoria ternatea TaxID=43366 RepID=A0AAN9FQ13_CLITE